MNKIKIAIIMAIIKISTKYHKLYQVQHTIKTYIHIHIISLNIYLGIRI